MKSINIKIKIQKRTYFFILIALSFMHIAISSSYAATPTQAPTMTIKPKTTEPEKEQKLIEQINTLKEKVASRVAELRLVEKRGIIVMVKEVSGNKITAEDMQGRVRIVDVDELTKFSSPDDKTSFGISDMKAGLTVSIIGLYNKQSKRILARFISVVPQPLFISGVVKEIDKANFAVTLVSEDNKSYTIDIENITKTSTYTESDNIKRSGFSKIEIGNRAYAVGFPNKGDKKRIIASRFITFPQLPANPKISLPTTKPEESENKSATKSGNTKTPNR